jgi:hypothetical protein
MVIEVVNRLLSLSMCLRSNPVLTLSSVGNLEP